MIDTEKYRPARQNMKFVTRSLCSLATKLHILARQADIFGINQFTSRHQSRQFTGLVYQCRSVLENIKVTTSLMT
jgi:hypothetical protein